MIVTNLSFIRAIREVALDYDKETKNLRTTRKDLQTREYELDQSWTRTVRNWKVNLEDEVALKDWLRKCVQHPGILNLVKIFPPACLVQAKVRVACPAPGTVGLVHRYYGDGERVGVLQNPFVSAGEVVCKASLLYVVGYCGPVDRKYIQDLLAQLQDTERMLKTRVLKDVVKCPDME